MSDRMGLAAALSLLAVLAVGCSTTPPPPPLVSSATVQTSGPSADASELIVGVDDLGAGFNPHSLADAGPVSLAIASIVLPSAFRPNPSGGSRLDGTVVESAGVTGTDPFKVTYRLRREASWSDGAPIAAEDFAYLADRMRAEPGVTDQAGYRLIAEVNSGSGGKTVEVVFSRPYPGWRTLFTNLLPSHLLKDAPGGWPEALEAGIGVSGGPFALRSVDRARGLAVLERNDRYWDTPAALDRLVLRESNHPGLVGALGTGGDQVALITAPDAIAMALLRDLGGAVTTTVVPQPVVASLVLRQDSRELADANVRGAVAAMLDRDRLVMTGTGNGPAAALRPTSNVWLPSDTSHPDPSEPAPDPLADPTVLPDPTVPTVPDQEPDLDRVRDLLSVAGYRQVGATWRRDGEPLRLVVGAPADRAPYPELADAVARQLRSAGVDADVVTPSGDELFAPAPDADPVDILVAPRVFGGDAATDVASWFSCPGQSADATAEPGPSINIAAFCDRTLQPSIDGALTGTSLALSTLAEVDQRLERAQVLLPLFQSAGVLVTSKDAVGVRPGGLLAGPFAAAAQWRRAGR